MKALSKARRRTARRAARKVADSTVMEAAARWGFAARGVVYLLVGTLAWQVALFDSQQQADRGGALHQLSGGPFGATAIWALGAGFAGMAVWRLSEAAVGASGHDGRKVTKRLQAAARCLVYSSIAVSVLAYASGRRDGSESSDRTSQDLTARVMELPGGRWAVACAGAGLAVGGAWIAVRALRRKFRKHLDLSGMRRRARRAVDVLGVVGGTSRGAVFAGAGVFAVRAALAYDPDRAKGVDDTLRSFAHTPAGPWLLAAVAAGLVLFGAFSLALARWRTV
ncbi:DUF1206 domain-containing protein [Streptomyces sp. TR06-5]|uniref:DUF1206 domain-containing protein n=1 Tax=Streptomyces sp. TR06-5 TaxID=3385976 RepID=UPI0039A2835A